MTFAGGAEHIIDLAGKTLTGGRLNALKSLTLPQASETGVTVELNSIGLAEIPRGGSFEFSMLVENNNEEPIFIGAIIYIKFPSGNPISISGPYSFEMPGGMQFSGEASLPVPIDASLGIYRLFVLIANPESLGEEVVEFEVTP